MRSVRKWVVLIASGVVGAWIGYWIGHAAGWSTNATWPWSIGGGKGAIAAAFFTSVVFITAASVLVVLLPGRRVRAVLEEGVPARATVVSLEKTGERSATPDGDYEQVRCDLDVRARDGARYRAQATQFLSVDYLRRLGEGSRVKVRYDASRRSSVAIVEPAQEQRR
ncbi:MAG: DUF3592 domain-containing protein [Thermoleophilia bacterium]